MPKAAKKTRKDPRDKEYHKGLAERYKQLTSERSLPARYKKLTANRKSERVKRLSTASRYKLLEKAARRWRRKKKK